MKNFNLKNMKGITLITLIITIIVLVILAGVSLNLVTKDGGIIPKSADAGYEYKQKSAMETMNLKITNMQIKTYAEEQRMPTLEELAKNLEADSEIEYVNGSQKVASVQDINFTLASSIFTKLKAYPYEFEINKSLQLASIDGVRLATNTGDDSEGTLNQNGDTSKIKTIRRSDDTLIGNGLAASSVLLIVTKPHNPVNLSTNENYQYSWEEMNKIAKAISDNYETVTGDYKITKSTEEVQTTINGKTYTVGVGDTITVGTHTARILGFNHDKLSESSAYGGNNTYAGISFEFIDFITTTEKRYTK